MRVRLRLRLRVSTACWKGSRYHEASSDSACSSRPAAVYTACPATTIRWRAPLHSGAGSGSAAVRGTRCSGGGAKVETLPRWKGTKTMPQSEARPTTTVMRRGRRCRRTISMHWRHASQPASALSGHATCRAELVGRNQDRHTETDKRTAKAADDQIGRLADRHKRTASVGVPLKRHDQVVRYVSPGSKLAARRPLQTRRAFLGAQLRGG